MKKSDDNVSYLGDGVYAVYDGSGIWLRSRDPKNPLDEIYLNDILLGKLNIFANKKFTGVA